MSIFFMPRKPSGRLEVVQLMRMMDNMLLKAGVDQQIEELTELSQVRQSHSSCSAIQREKHKGTVLFFFIIC